MVEFSKVSAVLFLVFPTIVASITVLYVDSEASGTLGDGTILSPYKSLALAINSSVSSTEIRLVSTSPQSITSMSISNDLVVLGSNSTLNIENSLLITGSLQLANLTIMKQTRDSGSLFEVMGKLTLSLCSFFKIPVLIVSSQGSILIVDSNFEANMNGVVSILAFGGQTEVRNCRFAANIAESGAVFRITPQSASNFESTRISVLSCIFEANSAKASGSVLALSDSATLDKSTTHFILFSNCSFWSQSSSIFFLSTSNFDLTIKDTRFVNESMIASGQLNGASFEFSSSSVFNSTGPLFDFEVSGMVNLTNCTFTNIEVGMLAATGTAFNISNSLILLSHLRLLNFKSTGIKVLGAVLTAVSSTVWISDISLVEFTCTSIGAFSVSSSAIYGDTLYMANGIADSSVFGLFIASSIRLCNLLIDQIGSLAGMASFSRSDLVFVNATYSRIVGRTPPGNNQNATSFLFIREYSTALIDNLHTEMNTMGTALIYLSVSSRVTVQNSVISGVIGRGVATVQEAFLVMRNCTVNLNRAMGFFRVLQRGYFEVDSIILNGTVFLDQVIAISSQSTGKIGYMELRNVTCIAIARGQLFNLDFSSLRVIEVRSNALFDFSVNM